MIISNKHESTIKGKNYEILIDFHQIFTQMIDVAPEILIAVIEENEDDVLAAVVECSPSIIAGCKAILHNIKQKENPND